MGTALSSDHLTDSRILLLILLNALSFSAEAICSQLLGVSYHGWSELNVLLLYTNTPLGRGDVGINRDYLALYRP